MERGNDMSKSQKGTLCVFAAALLYSIGGLCIKVIPWGGMAINGGRTAIALVVIGAYLLIVKHPLRLNRWVALGAVSVFGCNALFSMANKLTTAANTIVLQFTAPIFVLLISLVLFHRRPDKLDLITCAAVFGGILFFFLDSLEMGGGWATFWPCCPAWPTPGCFSSTTCQTATPSPPFSGETCCRRSPDCPFL